MFDIGFWEILFTSVIALVVLGPERLPGAIRSVLSTVRSVKRTVSQVTDDLKHELEIDELHKNLKEAEQQGMKGLDPELEASLKKLRERAETVTRPYSTEDIKKQVMGSDESSVKDQSQKEDSKTNE